MIYLYPVFFIFAFVYSMVGLGGGSAYVAILSVSKIPHDLIPATALFLNIIVTFTGFFNYRIYINFTQKKKFLFFLYILSMTGAFLGAKMPVKRKEFFIILGTSLILAALISFFREKISKFKFNFDSDFLIFFFSFLFGFLAGIVGIGGGIFLSPILLVAGFPVKEIAGITSIYIFLNSSAGFISHFLSGNVDFKIILPVSIFVLIGGIFGSFLGSFKIKPLIVKRILTLIIFIIGVRILWMIL